MEADFLWKVSLKILNSGIIRKTLTHVNMLFKTINLPWEKKYGVQNKANSAFWGGLSKESQSQNPEFRNNPENFHPWKHGIQNYKLTLRKKVCATKYGYFSILRLTFYFTHENLIFKTIQIWLIQHWEADFLWKVSLKILNSGTIRKTFIHENLKTIN